MYTITDYGTVKLDMYDAGNVWFEVVPQETGTIEDKPKTLKPKCYNDTPVDAEKAWLEIERSCRGG